MARGDIAELRELIEELRNRLVDTEEELDLYKSIADENMEEE